jgi:hypothetical protein
VSPKTSTWYRILVRLTRTFDLGRPVDGLSAPEIQAWLLELRTTLAPVSIAGYVRTLKAFGNWLQAEELAEANAFRSLRKPRVPVKLIEPVPDDTLRRLLGLASVRDRAILLRALRARFAEHLIVLSSIRAGAPKQRNLPRWMQAGGVPSIRRHKAA